MVLRSKKVLCNKNEHLRCSKLKLSLRKHITNMQSQDNVCVFLLSGLQDICTSELGQQCSLLSKLPAAHEIRVSFRALNSMISASLYN
jgi:hypothetical protein